MTDHLFTDTTTYALSEQQIQGRAKHTSHTSACRYERLFESSQDGLLILDALTGQITDVNPSLEHLLGYRAEEIIGKSLWHVGAFKNIARSKKAFLELQAAGYVKLMDLSLRTKSGTRVIVEFISTMYFIGENKVIQCSIRDITQRRLAELAVYERTKALEKLTITQNATKQAMLNIMEDLEAAKTTIEEKKAKDEAMLASIGDGLIAVNKRGKIIVLNASAESMLGYKEADLIGQEIACLDLRNEEGDTIPVSACPAFIAMHTQKSIRGTYIIRCKDTTTLPIALTVTPIMQNGVVKGAIEVFQDRRREMEIDKAKSEFVSLASHQLRTPLGIIRWYEEALQKEPYIQKSPVVIRRYLQEIYKNSARVLNLVRDLLSVSRIEQGQIKNTPVRTDVQVVLLDVVHQMRIIAKKKGITLTVRVRPKKFAILYIDALRLHEVIENLIVNAIAYTLTGGKVDVAMHKTKTHLILHIKDTGIGISPTDKKKLFTKFFRSELAAQLHPEGTGLGLYVVKSYVEEWGGTLKIKSSCEMGSIFTIQLPLSNRKLRKGGDLHEKNSNRRG